MAKIYEQTTDTTAHTISLERAGIDSHWLDTAPRQRTLLIVYAHPDDESFGNAGTILHYAQAGVAVHYACATRGECGTVDPARLDGYPDLAALRTSELLCAAQTLGLAGVHFLGYRDSGMAGTPDNQHPNALVQAPLARVAGQVTALIRALRPQVVLTFGPYGGYGHPDHITMHRATLLAFHAAADAARYPEQLDNGMQIWSPAKLYYSTFPTRFLRTTITMLRLTGRDPSQFGQNNDVDLVRAAAETTPITATIRNDDLVRKEQAWACHASQNSFRGPLARLPARVRRRMFTDEHFTRVVPVWRGGPKERDLFEGL